MTEKNGLEKPVPAGPSESKILNDDCLTAVVSSYLDGRLEGQELEAFEARLRDDEKLAHEISEMRRIERQLAEMGADILLEPIPRSLIEALS